MWCCTQCDDLDNRTDDDSQPFMRARYNAKHPGLNPNILPPVTKTCSRDKLTSDLQTRDGLDSISQEQTEKGQTLKKKLAELADDTCLEQVQKRPFKRTLTVSSAAVTGQRWYRRSVPNRGTTAHFRTGWVGGRERKLPLKSLMPKCQHKHHLYNLHTRTPTDSPRCQHADALRMCAAQTNGTQPNCIRSET